MAHVKFSLVEREGFEPTSHFRFPYFCIVYRNDARPIATLSQVAAAYTRIAPMKNYGNGAFTFGYLLKKRDS